MPSQDGKARWDGNVLAIKKMEPVKRSENRVGIYADCVAIEFVDKLLFRRNGAIVNSAGAAMLPVIHASTTLTNSIAIEHEQRSSSLFIDI